MTSAILTVVCCCHLWKLSRRASAKQAASFLSLGGKWKELGWSFLSARHGRSPLRALLLKHASLTQGVLKQLSFIWIIITQICTSGNKSNFSTTAVRNFLRNLANFEPTNYRVLLQKQTTSSRF